MKSKRIRMSQEEFEIMSHPFGWKAEYWDNHAPKSPREHIVKTRVVLELFSSLNKYIVFFIKAIFPLNNDEK